ncbi:MAG: OmpA family protein [Phycisphaeraceae bacterium]|nr:OmpA family protein [Phycisphaeraceae bacterium]
MLRKLPLLIVAAVALSSMAGCQMDRLKKERQALWTQNQELQAELEAKRAALDAAEAERAALLAQVDQLQSDLAARGSQPALAVAAPQAGTGFESIQGVEAERRGGLIMVRVPGDVLFASGKIDLKPDSRRTLDQIASVLQQQYPSNIVRIEGYTDIDPIRRSGWKDNLELSLERSAAVHRYMQSKGLNPERMYAAGFGQWHARDTKAKSRRVEIVVILNE